MSFNRAKPPILNEQEYRLYLGYVLHLAYGARSLPVVKRINFRFCSSVKLINTFQKFLEKSIN